MDNTEQIAQLKILVAKKAGLDSTEKQYHKALSQQIFLQTKNYLSEKTISQIYLEEHRISTLFILNSLAQFAGYNSWQDFMQNSPKDE